MSDFVFLQQKYLVNVYQNRGLSFVKGKGIFLYTDNGEKFMDFMSNYGVNILGYNNSKLNKALINQLKKLPSLHCSFSNDIRAIASKKLMERCGNKYKKIFWSNSGSEAIEGALKFAVLATGKRKFIACKNAYHGKTLGALSATYSEKYKEKFKPLLWDFIHIDFNSLEQLEKTIDNETSAFIVEPIQGEGGIIIPDKDYLKKARDICNKKEILLIIDEVQTGCGRTGRFLASNWEGVEGDILCLGKGLGGGIPIGATIVNEKVAESIPKASHTSTFGGNPLACSGVKAVLEIIDDDFLKEIEEKGNYFLRLLRSIRSDLIKDVRGKGLMIGIEVEEKRDEILKGLQKEKVLAIPAGSKVVRFLPPYIVEKNHIDYVFSKLEKILKGI